MRTLWGQSIDRGSENRDYVRVGELKAAVSVDDMIFPPLCPSCLMPNPQGVHPITVTEGYRAGLLHPIYVPHCKRCPVRAGLFRGNTAVWIGLAACILLAVGLLFYVTPFWPLDQVVTEEGDVVLRWEGRVVEWATFITWPYVPFFWLAGAAVVFCGYLMHRRGIWVHSVSEETVIFAFKHPEYCEQFQRANRIIGVRKGADELADWEARLCTFCDRPLQRGQEICSFCGRKVPGEAAPVAKVSAGAVAAEVGPVDERVQQAARETMEVLAERATRGGTSIEGWPKTVRCQCGRKYRIRHPGTYHCVDTQCGRTFLVE